MKRIYLLLLLFVAFAGKSFAQTDIQMLARFVGEPGNVAAVSNTTKLLYDADHPKKYVYIWQIKNAGGAAMAIGDTVMWRTPYFNGYFYNVLTKAFNVGDTLNYVDTLEPTPNSSITTSQTNNSVNWCDSAFARKAGAGSYNTDAVMSNNKLCNTISITWWVTSVQNVNEQNNALNVYPNPASGKLNVKANFNNANATVIVRDMLGKAVLQKELGKNINGEKEFTLDISNLQSGIYLVELNANDTKSVVKVTVQ